MHPVALIPLQVIDFIYVKPGSEIISRRKSYQKTFVENSKKARRITGGHQS
jgi:hypothetical protein